jgi:subtilisin family serine protease
VLGEVVEVDNTLGRIDCYAWGEDITTSGDGWTGTSTTSYTASFGGTSGATPIVAGAAVLLQSWRTRTLGQPHYAPHRLRELLSEAGNTPSANPGTDRIGVMPNLRQIIEGETPARGGRDRWMLIVQILFGIIQDGGGLGWVPGRGPVPVGPLGAAGTPRAREA